MKRKRVVVGMGIAVIVAVSALLLQSSTIQAQDCRVIRIQGMVTHQSIRVEPEVLSIGKGTCVIWFNRATANEIKIVFREGKRCASVSDAPMGFSLDHEQCFVTSWIPFGGTSSLRFNETGTYDYEVQITTGEAPEKGTKAAAGTILVE